ncbi:alpha/beta fold hydrolase [Stackebrandtia albiflava]
MGVPAGYYRRMATALHDLGYDVTVADLRGTGTSTPKATRTVDYGYAELVDDAEELLHVLRPDLGDRTVLLMGHSLGGHIASLLLARRRHTGDDPGGIHGLALVACGIPYHALYGRRAPVLYTLAHGMRIASRVRGHWPGHGFAGRQTRGVIRDWAHTVRFGRFVPIGGEDLDPALGLIGLPLLAVTVDGDRFTPPATSRHLTAKLTGTRLTEHHYTHAEAGARLDHFSWARASEPLLKHVTDFAGTL